MLGHRAEYLTFAWMVWEVTHDALYLGYLGLAQGVPLVVFQLWGGVLDQIMAPAPRATRIVVVGVCMEPDTIYPMLGISKELNLQFVLGYTPDEFAATLTHIAAGRIPVAPLVTGTVGVEGVTGAFEALASPERHAKILVEPWRA